jgi:hypothetical protein
MPGIVCKLIIFPGSKENLICAFCLVNLVGLKFIYKWWWPVGLLVKCRLRIKAIKFVLERLQNFMAIQIELNKLITY